MPLSVEEIRERLVDFAARWSLYGGSERAEAQTFLNQLFEAYGQDRQAAGARFEEAQQGKFLDLVWPRVCLVEMKRPSEATKLASHRDQALGYWREAADPVRNIPAPRYVVLCAFQRFEVWEPGAYPGGPRAEFELRDLPDRMDSLMFLAGREPVFIGRQEPVTREVVKLMTDLYDALRDRRAAPADELRDFILQAVWCMFAEDLGQLEGQLFTRLVDELVAHPERSSADDLGQLFEWLNRPGARPVGGLYRDTRYVNGGLFQRPARVHLTQNELAVLGAICDASWRHVEPHIFGSLLEGALGHDAQWALGAHYTYAADIQKVIAPTIIDPWTNLIENASSLREVQSLQQRLLNYVVLDPACGSGNFLYLAYRALRRLEARLRDREADLRRSGGHRRADQGALSAFFPLQNIRGLEIDPFAAQLARVTLWMGHKLAVDELGLDESTLPLEDLSGIKVADALRVPWPRATVIIGNPPFHGDRHLRALLGDDYVEWLRTAFDCGIKDHCVYWFRKAHDHLADGERAGLVGTNSIAQNRARTASTAYILDNGGVITNAIASQDWPGEANVDVSIVNWIKNPEHPIEQVELNGTVIDEPVASSLRRWSTAVERSFPLAGNDGKAFFGCLPGDLGFLLDEAEATALLNGKPDSWREIIRPYLIGKNLTDDPRQRPSRWVIDFGHRSLEEAMQFPEALQIIRDRVKPARDRIRRPGYKRYWWRFKEPLREMRDAVAPLERFIVSPAQAKRIQFSWADKSICPSNLVAVFAFDDDYSMGILSAFAHHAWLTAGWSSLEDRTRYTTSTVFATYPWPPTPTLQNREAVAKAMRKAMTTRQLLCDEHEVGLTTLYNHLDDGAFASLGDQHRELDRAVAAAYGWSADTTDEGPDETNRRLLKLNFSIEAGDQPYEPFGQ